MLLFVNLILRLGYSVKSAHTFVEPRHELRLDKRLAPCHGVHSLPALVDERRQVAQRAVDTLVGLNEYSGGAAGTQLALKTCPFPVVCDDADL